MTLAGEQPQESQGALSPAKPKRTMQVLWALQAAAVVVAQHFIH